MPGITKEMIDTLVRIQRIDIETAKVKALLEKVPVRISTLEQQREEFTHSIENEEDAITEFNKQYRTYESDLQLNLSKIKKSEEKLRSVKTNKEYQSSLKEIDDLKAIRSKFEDEMLEFLEKIETAEKALQARRQQYKEIVAETNREKATVQRDAEQNEKRLVELESDRSAIAAELDADLIALFNRVKAKQTNGVAIAEVENAVCLGCNMNIPPQIYNELQRRDSLKYCPSCERIIYWKEIDERSE
jgi:predicted  nucleic acid-binding Zn-ribbon protein